MKQEPKSRGKCKAPPRDLGGLPLHLHHLAFDRCLIDIHKDLFLAPQHIVHQERPQIDTQQHSYWDFRLTLCLHDESFEGDLKGFGAGLSSPLHPSLRAAMAANASSQGPLGPILSALATMQSNVSGKDKSQAHEFLEKFQKSVGMSQSLSCGSMLTHRQSEAWNLTHTMLQDSSTLPEARLFAATTLKGKVCAPLRHNHINHD